jgi:hypothetical protein
MRLHGSPSGTKSSKLNSGWPNSSQSSNLHLKNQTQFQEFIADAEFKRVTAEIVNDNLQDKSKPNQADKFSVFARIDENKKKLYKQSIDEREFGQSKQVTDNLITQKSNSYISEDSNPQNDLNNELKRLRLELTEVKTLAIANQKALNSLQPAPKNYKTGSQNSSSPNSGSSLSQAEIHYLRYGSYKSNLDIWA